MPKLLLGAILATVAVAAEPATLALTHVVVIDGDGTRAQPDLTVLIGGDRIASMGKKVRVPPGARVVNARGKFLKRPLQPASRPRNSMLLWSPSGFAAHSGGRQRISQTLQQPFFVIADIFHQPLAQPVPLAE